MAANDMNHADAMPPARAAKEFILVSILCERNLCVKIGSNETVWDENKHGNGSRTSMETEVGQAANLSLPRQREVTDVKVKEGKENTRRAAAHITQHTSPLCQPIKKSELDMQQTHTTIWKQG